MIKLHTKHKSNLNYYLFDTIEINDLESISKNFETEFGKQPLFSSFCTINGKSYAMIGTLEFLEIDDLERPPSKIFKSPKNDTNQDNPQLESFYLCNFKDKNIIDSILFPLLNDLIKWKIEPNTLKRIPSAENPIICSFKCTPDEIKYRIKILIPYFIENVFQEYFDSPIFTTKSDEVPVVMARNIDLTSEHQIDQRIFEKIKALIEKENYARVINFCESKQWVYFSVQSNDNSWEVINNLKYSTLHKELVQFTHFLDRSFIDVVNQWNLLLLDVNIEEDVKSIFDTYSNFENSEDSSSIKKILAIDTIEDSESKNAKIQFLYKSDAYEALRNDPKHIKIFTFSMIVHHYDEGKEEELLRIFKKATYIIEKQNNSQRTRPIYHIFFDSKSDLSDALLYSGTIDKDSIQAENDDEETNSKYVYKLSRGEDIGIFSNGLRAFCIAYRPNDDVDKIDNQLIKQSWKQNTVEIFDINNNVQLADAIEALTQYDEDCCLESIIFKRKSIVASFHEKYHFNQAISNKSIEINGTNYQIMPKKTY